MSCTDTWAHDALDRLFSGELSSEEHARLKAHVSQCPSCGEQYDRLSRAESQLERGGALSTARLELMQSELLARLDASQAKSAARAPKVRMWMPLLSFGLAAALAVVVWVMPKRSGDAFQPRGGPAAESAFGVRAFCVDGPNGKTVVGEALPGGKLRCAEGQKLQLTYTAPKPVALHVEVSGGAGVQPLFPAQGGAEQVAAGVDVPLSFSTPVTSAWLSAPVRVVSTFSGADGRVLATTAIQLEP